MSATDGATPVVSVCMITYNHERFIAQAIESVLMQETDFPVELVIGEDCSTDGTRAIVQDYAARYPDKIKALLHPHNLGPAHSPGKNNLVSALKACRGKYIALLEGDDYWTDPHKLQKQVEFLEAHPECSMCFHEAYDLWPDGRQVEYVRSREANVQPFYGLEEAIKSQFIPTASICFRRGLVDVTHPLFFESPTGDWVLRALLAEKGLVAFLDGNWATRRIHPGGLTSMAPLTFQYEFAMLSAQAIDQYLHLRYGHILRPYVLKQLTNLTAEIAYSTSDLDAVADTINRYSERLNLSLQEKRFVAGQVYYQLVFRERNLTNITFMRQCWWKALYTNLSTVLSNRGYWSIGLDLFVGKTTAAFIRRLLRRILDEYWSSRLLRTLTKLGDRS